jgi:hypothetical protein
MTDYGKLPVNEEGTIRRTDEIPDISGVAAI